MPIRELIVGISLDAGGTSHVRGKETEKMRDVTLARPKKTGSRGNTRERAEHYIRAILFFTFYLQLCFQRAISQIILPRARLQHDVLLIRREDLIKLSSLFFSERYYYS